MKTIVRRILCILHQVRASPSQATVSLSGLPHVNHSKNPLYPRLGYSTDTSDGNTKVIVSYLSMNLATHSILFFSHLIFNTNLNVLKYEGFIWCYIYNWLVIIIFFSQLQYTCISFKIPCQYIFVQFTMIRKHLSLIHSKWQYLPIYGVYSVDRTCKYWIEKGWSIYGMDCIADKPSGCKSKTYCVATYLKCQSLCQISVSRGDWWTVQKPMCTETWNCWLLCLTYNKE